MEAAMEAAVTVVVRAAAAGAVSVREVVMVEVARPEAGG